MDPQDVVVADPMMRILRERHPDVNIVLLPPVEPIRDRPAATLAQCRAAQQHASTVLATLATEVGLEPSTRVGYWWSQSHPDVRRWVTAISFAELGEAGAIPLLRTLGNVVARLGWAPRPAADGSPRIRGVAGPFELIASAQGEVVSVNITSGPLVIPVELFDVLRAEA